MKLTNRLSLPQPIFEAVKNDGYSSGDADISVTGLIAPARIRVLRDRHDEELEEDASDRIFSLLGQCVHTLLERSATVGIAERRLSIEVDGWRISGGMDYYREDGVLFDYKLTTSYKFKGLQIPIEFESQLNCYAEILRQNGDAVTQLQVVGILRDWSKMEAARDADYPQRQIVIRNVPLWPSHRALSFIKERVHVHKQAMLSLPECSPEDRWAKPDKWAVMKKGAERATKLYESPELAEKHAYTNPAFYVEHRKGESTRCLYFCPVSKFCDQKARMEAARVG